MIRYRRNRRLIEAVSVEMAWWSETSVAGYRTHSCFFANEWVSSPSEGTEITVRFEPLVPEGWEPFRLISIFLISFG
jgi:hypothetical protein